MPRPRKVTLTARPSMLIDAYTNGHSTRSVARTHGVTRWQVTQALTRSNETRRTRDEQVDLHTHTEILPRCPWPGCSSIVANGVCPAHCLTPVDGHCGWPRCTQPHVASGLCYWHAKRAQGAG